ncbi:MAG TPA: helix-turn-helix domain-containing protein [Nitrospira sp.]|nr:helix-turn-helix domain-containing protein [Nitrospira sp.]
MTLLTLIETAELLRVSPRTVRRLPIPRAYVGGQLRYDLSDLEAYVASRKQGGQDRAPSRPPASLVIKGTLSAQTTSGRIVQHRNPLFAIRGTR